jgi:uncharacterized alpha-E superfamily protein
VLRVFLARIGDRWTPLPGGFCRVADRRDARAISLQDGGRTADVCVLSGPAPRGAPAIAASVEPTPETRRGAGALPSRAADNLFWLGRYLERAEATLRLLRALGGQFVGAEDLGRETARSVRDLLEAWGAVPSEPMRPTPGFLASTAMHRRDLPGAVPRLTGAARGAAAAIRDRLSPDAWRAIDELDGLARRPDGPAAREAETFERIEQALRLTASLSGLAQENMVRLAPWRFLKLGCRIERAIVMGRFVRHFASPRAGASGFDVLLALADSQITYRMRYVAIAARAPTLDLVVLDESNPRSVAFQLARIAAHVELSPRPAALSEAPAARAVAMIRSRLAATAPDALDPEDLIEVERRLMALSDELTARYFRPREAAT